MLAHVEINHFCLIYCLIFLTKYKEMKVEGVSILAHYCMYITV